MASSSSTPSAAPTGPASPMHVERSESDLSSESSPPFSLHQKVLCRDANNKDHFYESKITKLKCLGGKEYEFFVHYNGWNSRWDRWAGVEDLFENTEENRKLYLKPTQIQEELQSAEKKRKKENESSSSRNKKKGFTEAFAKRQIASYEEYCQLPFTLKTVMVDEHDIITRKGFDSLYFYD
eukprot:scaffold2194_cov130-Cylindrotheca_fusiformis.AAC.1